MTMVVFTLSAAEKSNLNVMQREVYINPETVQSVHRANNGETIIRLSGGGCSWHVSDSVQKVIASITVSAGAKPA